MLTGADLRDLVPVLPLYVAVKGKAQMPQTVKPLTCQLSDEDAVLIQVQCPFKMALASSSFLFICECPKLNPWVWATDKDISSFQCENPKK